jgi:hypothetical protein
MDQEILKQLIALFGELAAQGNVWVAKCNQAHGALLQLQSAPQAPAVVEKPAKKPANAKKAKSAKVLPLKKEAKK